MRHTGLDCTMNSKMGKLLDTDKDWSTRNRLLSIRDVESGEVKRLGEIDEAGRSQTSLQLMNRPLKRQLYLLIAHYLDHL